MRFRPIFAVLWALVMTMPSISLASGRTCSPQDARLAEDAAAKLSDWKSVYHFHQHFLACDDGAIAEGVTDLVARLLATQWMSINDLASLGKTNISFLNFVYRHITESASADDLKKIASNARAGACEKSSQSICEEVGRRAEAALKAM
jgi:hypothetical protein